MSSVPQNTSQSASKASLFYHILVGSINSEIALWDNINDRSRFSGQVIKSLSVKCTSDETLLPLHLARLRNLIPSRIQSSYLSEGYCFRVIAISLARPPVSASESVAYELYQDRTLQSFPLKSKFELAYDLVQCGFLLLGTSGLAQ